MDYQPYKVCTSCGAEYAPDALECLDCGGKLEFRTMDGSDALLLPEEEATFLVRADRSVGYVESLAGALGREGIRSLVLVVATEPIRGQPPHPLYGLYVADADVQRAQEIDRERWLRDAPEEAAAFTYEEPELKGVCPACETKLPEGAVECPECGLVVGEEEDVVTCPECDAVVDDEMDRCPNCGIEFE